MADVRPVVLTVDHRFRRSDGSEQVIASGSEVVEVRDFKAKPAVVKRHYGVTLNLGNYESARIEVGVEVPCYMEDVELADEWAKKWCEDRLRAESGAIKADSKKSPI